MEIEKEGSFLSIIKHNGALKLILIVFILSKVSAFKSSVLNQKKFSQVSAIPPIFQRSYRCCWHFYTSVWAAWKQLPWTYSLSSNFCLHWYCLCSVHPLRCKRNKTYLPLLRKCHQSSAYENSRPNRLHSLEIWLVAGDMA